MKHTLDYSQLDHWLDQSLAESVKLNIKDIDESTSREAYNAAFYNGWNEAVRMIKLHAGLELTYGGHKTA